MVQEPAEPTLLLKRSSIPPVYSPPPPERPVPKSDKSDSTKENGFRRLLNRQQSITRGTASSLAKAVRNMNNTTAEKSPPSDTLRRKFSLRNRKQSLTADPQRRSSWSVFNTPHIVPDSPPLVRKKSKLQIVDSSPNEISVDAPSTAGNQQISSLETPSDSPIADEHTHNHDDDLPGYMRRPICAACTRNVKVTSSSETNHVKSSSSSSSRRSSFSTTTTTKSLTDNSLKTKSVTDNSQQQDTTIESQREMNESPEGLSEGESSDSLDNVSKRETSDSTDSLKRKPSEHSIFEEERSDSPSSPIPTKRTTQEKWCQLLSQQQHLLSSLVPSYDDDNNFDQDMIMIQQNISKLVTTPQEQYETLLLETQTRVLQKFTSMMQEQQQRQVPITPLPEIVTKVVEVPAVPQESYVQYNWQTQLEFSLARWKWSVSQWTGIKVGSGIIRELDFDSLGYPENVMISGICVTTEPGLLPKGLQKYFKPYEEIKQVICHKYVIRLTREKRLQRFQIMPRENWTLDECVKSCEFSVKYEGKTKNCPVKFGLLDRRHHCRSCGHIFCRIHSSNELPLFISNGEDRGEWARVCDSCFYSRIEPQCISRL